MSDRERARQFRESYQIDMTKMQTMDDLLVAYAASELREAAKVWNSYERTSESLRAYVSAATFLRVRADELEDKNGR